MNFGQVLEEVKKGKLAQRAGWNGKGMFIFMRPEEKSMFQLSLNKIKSLPQSVKDYYRQDITDEHGNEIPESQLSSDDVVKFTAYLCMKAADGTIVNGWLASQTDMLAEDWIVLE